MGIAGLTFEQNTEEYATTNGICGTKTKRRVCGNKQRVYEGFLRMGN